MLTDLVHTGSVLVIDPKIGSSEGRYSCEAKNEHGILTHVFRVSVFSKLIGHSRSEPAG